MLDPNECLRRILADIDQIDEGDEVDQIHAAHHIRSDFLELHWWVQRGGALPDLWLQNRRK